MLDETLSVNFAHVFICCRAISHYQRATVIQQLESTSTESAEIVAFIFTIPNAWLKFHLPHLLLKTGMLLEMLPNLEVCSYGVGG